MPGVSEARFRRLIKAFTLYIATSAGNSTCTANIINP